MKYTEDTHFYISHIEIQKDSTNFNLVSKYQILNIHNTNIIPLQSKKEQKNLRVNRFLFT